MSSYRNASQPFICLLWGMPVGIIRPFLIGLFGVLTFLLWILIQCADLSSHSAGCLYFADSVLFVS